MTEVVWKPLAGSQSLVMACPCHHILYEGTRGPGKTDAQVMFFRKNVGIGYGAFWRGVIFDREYKNLDDLIAKSQRWYPKFFDGAKFLASKSDYRWVWPTGEELLFRQIKKIADYWKHHGQEYPFIGWNELTKYPTPELYDLMMSCNRSSFLPEEHSPVDINGWRKLLPPIPQVVFSTTNPMGAGHNWVKRRFIDVAEPGEVVRTETEVFNPRTQQREVIVKTQVRIFGSYRENRYLSPEYVAELESIKEENRRRAWLWGGTGTLWPAAPLTTCGGRTSFYRASKSRGAGELTALSTGVLRTRLASGGGPRRMGKRRFFLMGAPFAPPREP